jgi:hypothetical protein
MLSGKREKRAAVQVGKQVDIRPVFCLQSCGERTTMLPKLRCWATVGAAEDYFQTNVGLLAMPFSRLGFASLVILTTLMSLILLASAQHKKNYRQRSDVAKNSASRGAGKSSTLICLNPIFAEEMKLRDQLDGNPSTTDRIARDII